MSATKTRPAKGQEQLSPKLGSKVTVLKLNLLGLWAKVCMDSFISSPFQGTTKGSGRNDWTRLDQAAALHLSREAGGIEDTYP